LFAGLVPFFLAHARGESQSSPAPAVSGAPRTTFQNSFAWPDTQGEPINAHGGGVIFFGRTAYWYGEARNPRGEGLPPSRGIACYSSKDLYNWKNEGLVLPVSDDPASDIASGCIIERPKVVYNALTKKFVLWFHLELKGQGYGAARAAVAVGDSPTGPFRFIRSLRPNAGRWPRDFPFSSRQPLTPEEANKKLARTRNGIAKGIYAQRDFEGGQMSRDMTVFVDDGGKAYLVSSAEENYTIDIHELTADYTDFTGEWARVDPGGHNEAPAILKHDYKYYLLASGCTGWAPNDARVLVADSIWGPWRKSGNPCAGGRNPVTKMGPDKTFGGQSTCLFSVPGRKDAWIAMFDVWRPDSLITSGHIWLPVKFVGNRMEIAWKDEWDLGVFR
jgi:hypothetical protein